MTNPTLKLENQMSLIKKLNLKSIPTHKILLILVLVYFFVFGVFMAYTAGQPDQGPHQYFSKRFSETWGFPEEDMEVGYYIVTGQPYLYYWLNGAITKIYEFIFPNTPPIRTVIVWRLFSVLLSTFTVYYSYKLAKKVTGNPYAGVLAAFFLSNTLMFVFVSGAVNYDNLMNLAAMAAIYHLVNVYKGENFVKQTALTGTWVIIGSLTKEQFLLLTLLIFIAWVYYVIRNFKSLNLSFTKTNILVVSVFVVFLALFIGLYGVNLIRYSRTTPICLQIKDPENCGGFVNRREYYSPFSLRVFWFQRDNTTNFIQYAQQFWFFKMAESIWGIISHNTFVPLLSVALHTLLTFWGFINLVRYWKPQDKIASLLIFILLAYSAYIFRMNFRNEVNFSFQHFGISGRYLSPVYGVLFTLMIHYFLKIKSTFLKRMTLTLSIMLYFSGGLWMYVSRYAERFVHWRFYQ